MITPKRKTNLVIVKIQIAEKNLKKENNRTVHHCQF